MAVEVKQFRSDSGRDHDAEHDAWLDDLDHWLKAGGFDNQGLRAQLVQMVRDDVANGNHLAGIIANLKRTAPPRAAEMMEIAA